MHEGAGKQDPSPSPSGGAARPCFRQDSPHKKLLAAGGRHEGGEDQEDLHGERTRASLSP